MDAQVRDKGSDKPESSEVMDLATPRTGPAMLTYAWMCFSTQSGSSSVTQTRKFLKTLSPQEWDATTTCTQERTLLTPLPVSYLVGHAKRGYSMSVRPWLIYFHSCKHHYSGSA